jgi:hypothetical protein
MEEFKQKMVSLKTVDVLVGSPPRSVTFFKNFRARIAPLFHDMHAIRDNAISLPRLRYNQCVTTTDETSLP